ANFAGSVSPAISASSRSRPEAPSTSVATLASLILASSSTLLDAVDRCRPLLDQLRPLPRQVTQLPDRLGRHGAGVEQPVLQQLGDPLTVLDVGLAAGHLLDVLGVDQDDTDAPLQEVEDRLPGDARRYHGHVRDIVLGQPVREGQQVGGHGRQGADLLEDLAGSVAATDADDDVGLVDVDASTAGVEGVQDVLPVDLSRGRQRRSGSLLCVLPAGAGATVSGSWRCPGQTLRRACGTNLTYRPSSEEEGSRVRIGATSPFSWFQGAATRHDDSEALIAWRCSSTASANR